MYKQSAKKANGGLIMKLKARVGISLLALLTLIGCRQTNESSSSNSSIAKPNTESGSSITISSYDAFADWKQGENYFKDAEQPDVKRPQGIKNDFGKMRRNEGKSGLSQQGQANVLVVPVQFKDADSSHSQTKDSLFTHSDSFDDDMLVNIEDSFFGEDGFNDMNSVQEFYKKSSYEKLDINGVVAPIYEIQSTYYDFAQKAATIGAEKVITDVMEDVYKLYFTGDTATYDPHDFDSDRDNLIDNIILIYSEPYRTEKVYSYSTTSSKVLWTSLFGNNTYFNNSFKDRNIPVGSFTWESYYDSYVYDTKEQYGIRAAHDNHIYINQMGKALGLEDYYDSSSKRSPLSGLDMMDGALFDHNPFSKYLMGWINPTVVNSTQEVKLNSFQEDGSSILLRADLNDNPYGEYLLISYYTTDGLNDLDANVNRNNVLSGNYPLELLRSTSTYSNNFNEAGIEVFKIDARLVKQTDNGYALNSDSLNFDKNIYDFAYSNNSTAPYSQYGIIENYGLVELLSKDGMNRHMTSTDVQFSSSDLFLEGDSFGSDDQIEGFYKDFKFDSGDELNMAFTVSSLDTDFATINFVRR